MITANEVRGLAMATIRKERVEALKLFDGFLEYAEKRIVEQATAGKYTVKILNSEFSQNLKYQAVPSEIIADLACSGYKSTLYSDFEDGNGLNITWEI